MKEVEVVTGVTEFPELTPEMEEELNAMGKGKDAPKEEEE